jgi:hypothetical protein
MELSSFRHFRLRNSEMLVLLVLRIHETPNPDMSMALSFRDFPQRHKLLPRVPSRWTVLVVSRFRNLRHPMTEILCQLETPVDDMPMVSSMFSMCPNKCTTVICLRFHDLRCRDFTYRGFVEQSPSLVQLPILDFAMG